MTTTHRKRQHQVPRAYLARFASDGKVRVHRRDGTTFEADPINVAVESGFYDIPDGAGGKSDKIEGLLEKIEDAANEPLQAIDRNGRPPPVGSDDREALARLLGLQMTRTTQPREQVMFPKRVTDWAGDREVTKELVAEYLRVEHLGFEPCEPEVEGAYVYVWQHMQDLSVVTPTFAIEMMLQVADAMVERILALHWTIETDRRREFITSDVPVIPWRKPTVRDNFEGLGIDKAEELRFPLDPGKQLILSRRKRPPQLDVVIHRVRRVNADLAAACHRFVVGNPNNRAEVDRWLHPRRPVLRFNVAPLFMEGPDGKLEQQPGDVIHMFVPRAAGVGPRGPGHEHPAVSIGASRATNGPTASRDIDGLPA